MNDLNHLAGNPDILKRFEVFDGLNDFIQNKSVKDQYQNLSKYFKFTIDELLQQQELDVEKFCQFAGINYHEMKMFYDINNRTADLMDEIDDKFAKGLAWTKAKFPEAFKKVYGV